MVRGELFAERGKWKYTVQIDMQDHYNDVDLYRAVRDAFRETSEAVRGVRGNCWGYWLVVLEPYHRNAYPVMVLLEDDSRPILQAPPGVPAGSAVRAGDRAE